MPPPPPLGGFGALARRAQIRFARPPVPTRTPQDLLFGRPAPLPITRPSVVSTPRTLRPQDLTFGRPGRRSPPPVPITRPSKVVFTPRMLITKVPTRRPLTFGRPGRVSLPFFKPAVTRPKEIMRLPSDGRPGDQRGFIHKKLLKAVSRVSSFIPGPAGALVSGITGRLAGGGSGRTPPRTLTARPSMFSAAEKEAGRTIKFSGVPEVLGGCVWPSRRAPDGTCKVFLGERPGPDGDVEVGEAVMGQYGAALTPGSRIIDRAVCLRGMQLGNDGLCYNKGQIRNNQRMWPAGRKPLLTGGDMRAIQIAARAGRRLEGATKRLQRMGMMKKPTSRRALPRGRGPMVIKEAGAGGVTVQ